MLGCYTIEEEEEEAAAAAAAASHIAINLSALGTFDKQQHSSILKVGSLDHPSCFRQFYVILSLASA
jgi:hypothetical protein